MTENQVQYIIDFQNRFSDKLDRISRDVAAFNSRMDATGQRLQKRFDDYGNRIGALPGKIERLQDRLTGLQGRLTKAFDEKHIAGYNRMIQSTQKELEKLGKIGLDTGNKLPKGGGGLGFLKNLGMGGLLPSLGIAMGVGAVAGGVKEIFATTAKYEQLNTGFQVLLGSKAKGDAMVGQLMQYASKSPLRNEDVMPAAQTLLGFGVSAEKILPSIKMLGDVSMGNKEKFSGLALAFAQSSAAGRLMGQDLLQMVSNGFNPLQEISEMTGRSIGQLKKDMEGGKISSDMVTKAFEHATTAGGRFYDMANKQSETLGGRLSTVQDNIDQMTNAIGQRLYPVFSKVLGVVSSLVGKVTEWFSIKTSEKLEEEGLRVNSLANQLFDHNIKAELRNKIYNELKDIQPDILKGIDSEKINYNLLRQNVDQYNKSLLRTIALETQKEKLAPLFKKVMDLGLKEEEMKARANTIFAGAAAHSKKGDLIKTIAQNENLPLDQKIRTITTILKKEGYNGGLLAELENMNNTNTSTPDDTFKKLKEKKQEANDKLKKQLDAGNRVIEGMDVGNEASSGNPPDNSKKPGGNPNTPAFEPAAAIDSVASGGSKAVNISVTFGKLVENINVHANGIKESMNDVVDQTQEAMLRVLNGMNKLATKQ